MKTTNRVYKVTNSLDKITGLILLITGLLLFSGQTLAANFTCGVNDNPQNSGNTSQINFHSVNFNEDNVGKLPVNKVLYMSNWYSINYSCYANSTYEFQPALEKLNDFNALILNKLNAAGLGLQIEIQSYGIWDIGNEQYFKIGSAYTGNSGLRTLKFRVRLYVKSPITKPLKTVFSPATAFKIIFKSGGTGTPGVSIPTSGWTLQYVPSCIGKVDFPTTVRMGRIISGGENFSGTLPRQSSFRITARYNEGCTTSSDLSVFGISLKIRFDPIGSQLTDTGKAIVVSNTDGEKNGLKLKIQDMSVAGFKKFVPFDGSKSDFSGLGDSVTTYSRNFTAWLYPISNDPKNIKSGNFSIPVTIKITYD